MSPRKLLGDDRGITATEFAIVMAPLSIFLMTGMEMAYQGYAASVLQGTVYEAGRAASLDNADTDVIAANVKSKLTRFSDLANIQVEVDSFEGFGKIGAPEKITTDNNNDGTFDYSDGDCYTDDNRNNAYDTASNGRTGKGDAEDVVRYRVTMQLKRLTPGASMFGMSQNMPISRTTYVKNEPYAKVLPPPTRCGVVS